MSNTAQLTNAEKEFIRKSLALIDSLNNEQAQIVWDALKLQTWGKRDLYCSGLTMDDYAQEIKIRLEQTQPTECQP